MLQHQRMGYDALSSGLAGAAKETGVAIDQNAVERTAEALFIEAVAAGFLNKVSGMNYEVTAAEARRAAHIFHATGPNAGRPVVPRQG